MAPAILVFDSSVTGVKVNVVADQTDIERDLKMLTAELTKLENSQILREPHATSTVGDPCARGEGHVAMGPDVHLFIDCPVFVQHPAESLNVVRRSVGSRTARAGVAVDIGAGRKRGKFKRLPRLCLPMLARRGDVAVLRPHRAIDNLEFDGLALLERARNPSS